MEKVNVVKYQQKDHPVKVIMVHRQKEVQVKKVNIPLELIVINREQRMCMNIMIIMRRQGRILQGRFNKI